MNKVTLQLVAAGSVTLMLSGCSTFFTDSSDDYQQESAVASTLEAPEGSVPSKDVLVIPNENAIADLEDSKPFVNPRAPFIFYPMVKVDVAETSDAIELIMSANGVLAKRIVTDFLTAIHGAGSAIAEQTDTSITTVPFDFHPQGYWAALWSDITRLHPAKTAFQFNFSERDGKTVVSVQYRDEVKNLDPSDWMTPANNEDAHTIVARLWGTMGRQLNQSSAYLSNRGDGAPFPIWVDHQGHFSLYLGKDVSPAEIETNLNAAGFYFIPDAEQMIAPVPNEEVERVGDVISFDVPNGTGGSTKLFNVRRRNLDDVSWDKREYSYKITHQKAGDFLVIDVSTMEFPELTSFLLAQRFVK
ncbi:hypothetical protein J9B83_06145 [Marinomonas sp. A79]|uniref:Outer membrane protein assembly factor BamC n=1 Tax=Marinomonas vulgaris TaxID=2823372 RepID=A0ABS5HC34_9GAMM|nr:hypothetical protein [Marinomonas vulgaris]MBR7888519.1 hypothetical protein [Marinomonas vulgaris]